MKGNKMSAILAIVILLGALVFVTAIAPRAHAADQAASVQAVPNISWTHPPYNVGETFTADITVTGVTGLYSFTCGFNFTNTALICQSVAMGSFLTGGVALIAPVIYQSGGYVEAGDWSQVGSTTGVTGSGTLLVVTFEVNPALTTTNYTGTWPGSPVKMIGLSSVFSPIQLLLTDYLGNDVTPAAADIYNSTFTLSIVPQAPTAAFTAPSSAVVTQPVTFSASASTPGFDGYNTVPITWYDWNFGDGTGWFNLTAPSGATTTHTFTSVNTFTVTLVVNASSATYPPSYWYSTVTHSITIATVVPQAPIAYFTVSAPPLFPGATVTFDASGSTQGWNGYSSVPITQWDWNFGDGTGWFNGSAYGPTMTHTFATTGTYTVTLVVNASSATYPSSDWLSAPYSISVTIVPPTRVFAYPSSVVWTYPAHYPGDGTTFSALVEVANVTDLYLYDVGFTFNATVLQVVSVSVNFTGNVLTLNGGQLSGPQEDIIIIPGSVDNVNGIVYAWGVSLTNPLQNVTVSGSEYFPMMNVTFEINPALSPPYSGSAPGTPVPFMSFSTTNVNTAVLLMDVNGKDVTPVPSELGDGFFTLTVPPSAPVALFGIATNPVYLGTTDKFVGSASTEGWNGYEYVPITSYDWNFGDGSPWDNTTSPYVFHTYAATGTYTVTLVVNASSATYPSSYWVSLPVTRTATVLPIPVGCWIDLTSQSWRYIDPIYLSPVPNGAGPNQTCTLFRPGDYVQLFAAVSFDGAPVAGALVSFEVVNNVGTIVALGTSISNATGVAQYDFRVPWPTAVTSEFGWWTAIASWQIGAMNGSPYEKTQIDTMPFEVGWGLWIQPVSITLLNAATGTAATKFYVGQSIEVKVNVENDYQFVVVPALAVANIYDDLNVPLSGPAYMFESFNPGVTTVIFGPILIPSWAFVGTGTATANLLTTYPWNAGTAYCPQVSETFALLE